MEPNSSRVILCGLSLAQNGFSTTTTPCKSEFPEAPTSRTKADIKIAPSDAGVEAANTALKSAGLDVAQIDLLISCSQTPDLNNPSLASSILFKLGAKGTPGLEIRQSSAGAIYALDLAAQLVTLKEKKIILVVATEFLARFFAGYEDSDLLEIGQRQLCSRCSDGAGAFIVGNHENIAKLGGNLARSFEVSDIFVGASPNGWKTFSAELPSSSQFPLRLTREDVVLGRHLPKLDESGFIEASNKVVNEVVQGRTSSLTAFHAPVSSRHFAGALGSSTKVFDIYDQVGFMGAAGVIHAACNLIKEDKPTFPEVVLLGVGSGIQIGRAVLRLGN